MHCGYLQADVVPMVTHWDTETAPHSANRVGGGSGTFST
jgi:hypothetical protein